jgi:membrane protease YdiL (CAAX protease family)
MLNAIISALIQLAVVLLVALAVWLIARRPRPYREFIGFTAAPPKALAIGLLVGLVVVAGVLLIPAMAELAAREGTTGSDAVAAGGVGLVIVAAAGALVQTSLTEEILFRGLIGRNLIRRYGFAWGNGIQAVLFGAVHALVAFVPGVGPGLVVFAVLFSGTFGWVNGWLNERLAGGSILPGWAAHGAANLATALWVAQLAG